MFGLASLASFTFGAGTSDPFWTVAGGVGLGNTAFLFWIFRVLSEIRSVVNELKLKTTEEIGQVRLDVAVLKQRLDSCSHCNNHDG